MSDEKDLSVPAENAGETPRVPRPRKAEKSVTLFGAVLMQVITVAVCISGAYVLDSQRVEAPPSSSRIQRPSSMHSCWPCRPRI